MRFGFILLFLPLCSGVWAQPEEGLRFFPLEAGNSWTYFKVLDPPNAPPDTIWGGVFSVSGPVPVNDTLYYLVNHPFAFANTLREDEEGRIRGRVRGHDVLLFDFTLDDGATYTFPSPDWPEDTFQVTITRDLTARVGAGQFEEVVLLGFDDPAKLDDEHAFAFAPGVGIVYAYGTLGDYEELYSAVVGGRIITSVKESGPVPGRLEGVFAYPNPFVGATTVAVSFSSGHNTRVNIYDMLGRRVAILPECEGESCRFTWDASAFPPGTYHARIEQGQYVETIPLVRIR